MTPNELRIGNWVMDIDPYNQEFQISGLNIHKSENGWKYRAIPLTPDILERCGLKEKPNHTVFHINQMDFFIKENYVMGAFNDNEYGHEPEDEIKITSLHQLQNLYFALTGKELEYAP